MSMYRDENVFGIKEEDLNRFEEVSEDLDEKLRYVREKGSLRTNFTLASVIDSLYQKTRKELERVN